MLERKHLAIHSLIEQQIALLQPHAERRQLRLIASLQEATIEADALLLGQAIANLLDNAIDFSPADGCITLQGERTGEHYRLAITDQGAGIPDYAQPRLFERFYSLPRPHKGKSTGLGLSFVREVVERHQGTVTLVNNPGAEGGACATLTLPIRR